MLVSNNASAFKDGAWNLGIGYFGQNQFGKITKDITGKASSSGTFTLPFIVRFDGEIKDDYFMAVRLEAGLLGRQMTGGGTVNIYHLYFPVGGNISLPNNQIFEWYGGLGIMTSYFKGPGGTQVLDNGNSTSTFALPSSTTSSRIYTIGAGCGVYFEKTDLGFTLDLLLEGPLGGKKTAMDTLMSLVIQL